jgi:hypothetical protein
MGCVERRDSAYPTKAGSVDEKTAAPGSNSEAAHAICSIDFANFTYVWPGSDQRSEFTLVQGSYKPADVNDQLPPIRLLNVYFGDATGDGLKDAVLVMSISTGGSALPHLVYVYELSASSNIPKLLWNFESGDRASDGLRSVYTYSGQLVVETYNEFPNKGDCCPITFKRTAYQWEKDKFRQIKEERLPNPTNSANISLPNSKCSD